MADAAASGMRSSNSSLLPLSLALSHTHTTHLVDVPELKAVAQGCLVSFLALGGADAALADAGRLSHNESEKREDSQKSKKVFPFFFSLSGPVFSSLFCNLAQPRSDAIENPRIPLSPMGL